MCTRYHVANFLRIPLAVVEMVFYRAESNGNDVSLCPPGSQTGGGGRAGSGEGDCLPF